MSAFISHMRCSKSSPNACTSYVKEHTHTVVRWRCPKNCNLKQVSQSSHSPALLSDTMWCYTSVAFKWWEAWEEDRQPEENLILVALHKITLKWGYFERIQRDFLYYCLFQKMQACLCLPNLKLNKLVIMYCASDSINSCCHVLHNDLRD